MALFLVLLLVDLCWKALDHGTPLLFPIHCDRYSVRDGRIIPQNHGKLGYNQMTPTYVVVVVVVVMMAVTTTTTTGWRMGMVIVLVMLVVVVGMRGQDFAGMTICIVIFICSHRKNVVNVNVVVAGCSTATATGIHSTTCSQRLLFQNTSERTRCR